MLLGGIGIVDLRLAGAWRKLSPAALLRALTPVAVAGFLLLALSGPVMLAADARALATNSMLQLKLAMIALGLLNAALFAMLWRRRADAWSDRVPTGARIAGIASLTFWLLAAAFGRLIAYV